jgi:hypothetical protein
LGIGDWAQSPIPNPQSPIPNPQSPSFLSFLKKIRVQKLKIIKKYNLINSVLMKRFFFVRIFIIVSFLSFFIKIGN